jgi:hypothetical protein
VLGPQSPHELADHITQFTRKGSGVAGHFHAPTIGSG